MLSRFHRLPVVLVLVGLLASLVALGFRYGAERQSRAVSQVLDYTQLRTLAAATGHPLEEAMRQFKAAGITGVAVTEETLADLQTEGTLVVEAQEVRPAVPVSPPAQRRSRRRRAARAVPVTPSAGNTAASSFREQRVRIGDPVIQARVAEYVSHLVGGATETAIQQERVAFLTPEGGAVYVPGRFEDLRLTPTGLDAAAIAEVRSAGLEPIARINNALGLTPASLRWDVARVKALGISTVIFAGEEVLGFEKLLKPTAEELHRQGLKYGSVEFGKQRGDEAMARLMQDRLVRVHSISAAEMPRLSLPEAVERYVRAASERNIRLNYVRLPGSPSENTWADALSYVRSLSAGLVAAKLGWGTAKPFPSPWPYPILGRVAHALIGLGIGAAVVLLVALLFPLPLPRQATYSGVAGLLCGLLAFTGWDKGQQLLALAAAVTYPALAFLLLLQPVGAFHQDDGGVRNKRKAVMAAFIHFGLMSAVTLAGAFMVAGLLSELDYMVKVKSFAGIKIATVVPIAIVGWVYLTGMSGDWDNWDQEKAEMTARLRSFVDEPLRIWHLLAFLGGAVAIVLLLARSGNDSGVGVSELELRFRSLLDRIVGVRPRTKEFLVGHPALLLGLLLSLYPRSRKWALPLLLLGGIGQVGMLNSFCHLHSPLKINWLHTWNGLWTGSLIGLAAMLGWLAFQPNSKKLAKRTIRSPRYEDQDDA